jgi:predicted HTH transcriptional regulator
MSETFYPFVGAPRPEEDGSLEKRGSALVVNYETRIAVYDDAAAAPRVLVVSPKDVRSYLEEITREVTRLSHEQGGSIPFMVIREVVENLIHAYFTSPTVSILDDGNTIRFSDQGPGIKEKDLALEYGTTSATEEMRKYIRGVGSGLPYVQQYMIDKGGFLSIEDNISSGVIVTISTNKEREKASSELKEHSLPSTGYVEVPAFVRFQKRERPSLSDREKKVVEYLKKEGKVGPSDLVKEYGSSSPTWSRCLTGLSEKGLIEKDGQKYHLLSPSP